MISRGSDRRVEAGLTLVEVVAALVLLSVLGMTLLPILISARSAMRTAAMGAPPVSQTDLAAFADEWLDSREAATIDASLDFERDVSTSTATLPVRIRSVGPASDAFGHQWLAFECAGVTVLRCAPVEANFTAEAK